MSTNKKKEDPYVKYAVPRDLTLESFKEEDPSKWFIKPKYRLKAQVIDETSHIRGPKPPPPYDPLLSYLEWKVSLPWHKRLFLP